MAEKETVNPSTQSEKISFETLSKEETVKHFDTDIEKGLTEQEAKARLEKYGPNKLQEKKKKSAIRIFFEQMNNTPRSLWVEVTSRLIGDEDFRLTCH